MKSLHTLLAVAVLIVSLFAAAGVVADEESIQKRIQLALGDGEVTTIDVSDLEEGESHQQFVGDKELIITNTGDGLRIEIDGEEIDLGNFGSHHHVEVHSEHGDNTQVFSSTQSKVIVKHLDGTEGHGFHFISGDGDEVDFDFDMDGEHTWVSEDGERRVMLLGVGGHGGDAAAQRLEASGVLEDLDSAKKEAILEALRGMGGPHVDVDKEVIFIRKGADEDVH